MDTYWHLDTYRHLLDTYWHLMTLRTSFWVLILWTWANDQTLLLTKKAKPISARILRALKKLKSRLTFLILMEMMSEEHSTTLFQRRRLSLSSSFKAVCISHKKGHALKALRPKGQSPLNMMHKVVHFEIIFYLPSRQFSTEEFFVSHYSKVTQ